MNYHSEKSFLKELLLKGKRWTSPKSENSKPKLVNLYNSGVYIISRGEKDHEMKLGLSTNLYNRITGQYMICFPERNNFWCRYFFICPPTHTKTLEKALLTGIKTLVPNQYSAEWVFNARGIADFESKIKAVLNKPEIVRILQIGMKMTSKGLIVFDGLKRVPFPPARVIRETGTINRELVDDPKRKYKTNATKPKITGKVHKNKALTPTERDKAYALRAKTLLTRAKTKKANDRKKSTLNTALTMVTDLRKRR